MTQLIDDTESADALPPLWKNWRFQVFWSGAAASMLGLRIAALAYPLLILSMTGSPATAGVFSAVQVTSMLLFAMYGGAVADRADRRLVLISALGCQALASASVPIAWGLHILTVGQLMIVAALMGIGTAFGGPVRMLALRSLVPPRQLSQALVQEEVRSSGGSLLGPPLAGVFFSLGRVVPILATAAGCVIAVCSVLVVRSDIPARREGRDPARPKDGFLSGLRMLWARALLRAVLGLFTMLSLVGAALILVIVVKLRDHGASSSVIGFVLAGEAAGGLLGAMLTRRIHRLLGPGKLLLGYSWLSVIILLVLVVPAGPVLTSALLALMALGGPAITVMLDLLIFRQVPDEVRGRVIAATITLTTAGAPLGSLVAGLLLQYASPTAALCALSLLLLVPVLAMTANRDLRTAEWPPSQPDQR